METLTVTELMHLLSISREDAKGIIEISNEDLCILEHEDCTEEFRAELLSRNYAPVEYIRRVVPKTNSVDPRYHDRSMLDVVINGLGKGLSLRMKMELREGVNLRKNKTLLRFASVNDQKVRF